MSQPKLKYFIRFFWGDIHEWPITEETYDYWMNHIWPEGMTVYEASHD